MAIEVRCEQCGARSKAPFQLAGARMRCPACGADVDVPVRDDLAEKLIIHETTTRAEDYVVGDSDSIKRISDHVERYIGAPTSVYHEIVSDRVHIDIHVVEPTPDKPYYTLVTSGMSDRPMTVPEGAEEYRHAELMLSLPRRWPMARDHETLAKQPDNWPIRWLYILARYPHLQETWFGFGHTIDSGVPPRPFAENVGFCAWLFAWPMLAPEGFERLEAPDKTIYFYALFPLYLEETDFKVEHGAEALLDRLADRDVTELLDIDRPNVCLDQFDVG